MASLILTTTGVANSASGAITIPIGGTLTFTVTPTALFTGQVYTHDGSPYISDSSIVSPQLVLPTAGFNPAILTFANSLAPQTFVYTASVLGYRPIWIDSPNATASAPIYIFVNEPGYFP